MEVSGSSVTDGRKIVSALAKMANADMSFVFDQLLFKGQISEADVEPLEREFKRFIALVAACDEPLAIIGPLIDAVWHQFILFTEEYERFCIDVVGHAIHHRPDTRWTPVPPEAGENFMRAYEVQFGALPAIWWKGMSEAQRDHYKARPIQGPPAQRWSGWAGRVASPASE